MARSQSSKRTTCLPSRLVFSDAHKGRSCSACTLCSESSVRYTHPVSWKNSEMLPFVRSICGGENVNADSCICLNCRDSINKGMKCPDAFKPRWRKKEKNAICMHVVKRCTNIPKLHVKLQ